MMSPEKDCILWYIADYLTDFTGLATNTLWVESFMPRED